MEKRRFESFEVFSCLKKVNPRILSTFKRSFSKKMGKKPSSHTIHSLGGEYCWIVRGSEPIRLLKSPRSLNVYILSLFSHFWDKNKGFCTVIGVQHSSPSWTMSWWRIKRHILRTDLASSQFNKTKHSACAKQEHSNDNLSHCGSYGFKD